MSDSSCKSFPYLREGVGEGSLRVVGSGVEVRIGELELEFGSEVKQDLVDVQLVLFHLRSSLGEG